jgi:ankyrin repeat protein
MGNIEIIDLIRDAGGNPLARDKQGKTPFSIVLRNKKEIIKAVLGDKRNITDSDGNSPIHIVVKNDANNELLKMLIEDGYPIDTRNSDGYTPLNYAIEADNTTKALILLENNANPFQTIDKKGTNGVTIALEKISPFLKNINILFINVLSGIKGGNFFVNFIFFFTFAAAK